MSSPIIKDPQFGEIVDFELVRQGLRGMYDRLSPQFNMLDAIDYGHKFFDDHPSYLIAAGASMLAWMMLLASDETDLAEDLKDNIFTLGWTEEAIGSDLLSISTQATPMSDNLDERNFHIKGSKWLINNSYHADYHLIIAKIDPSNFGPRSLSVFLVPHSSTSNWQHLDTHVLRNIVLTKYDVDGPGKLVGKLGHGLSIVQKMASAARYQCTYIGIRMCQNSVLAAIDHLSSKMIFSDNPINFSNVFRQVYNLVLQATHLNFMFHRAVVYSDTSFLEFHGTMLKSFVLLRVNELLAQNLLVAGSKGFLKESIMGRDAIDSFVLSVFDGHYTINTLMTAKHITRYLNASNKVNMEERIATLREKLFKREIGSQLKKTSSVTRRPAFFDYAHYWKQLDVPLPIDIDMLLNRVRDLMTELDNTTQDAVTGTKLSLEAEYKYKIGTLVHWLESLLAAAEFWKVIDSNDYLNGIVQQYNGIVKAFNDIISEGALQTEFLNPIRHCPLPTIEDKEEYLRKLLDIQSKIECLRENRM